MRHLEHIVAVSGSKTDVHRVCLLIYKIKVVLFVWSKLRIFRLQYYTTIISFFIISFFLNYILLYRLSYNYYILLFLIEVCIYFTVLQGLFKKNTELYAVSAKGEITISSPLFCKC